MHALAGMADATHVHVTQALKGSLADLKSEQEPHATPPHRYTPASDEDALTSPHPSPENGLDSIQLENDLSSPGLQGVKPEDGKQVTSTCAWDGMGCVTTMVMQMYCLVACLP